MNQFFVETPSPYTISPDDVAKVFGLANHGKSVINSVRENLSRQRKTYDVD
jgi:hypothetical protein